MKPFDLEAAKRGEPVCTKKGYAVQIVYISDDEKVYTGHKILGYVTSPDGSKGLNYWYLNGKNVHYTDSDLFMAPKKVKVYLFVFSNKIEMFSISCTSLESLEKTRAMYTRAGGGKVSEIQTVEVEM